MRLSTKRFAKLLFPLLGLCVVSLAILRSFTVVNGTMMPNPHENYYALLDQREAVLQKEFKKAPGANLNQMRDLALVLWENNKIEEAEPYLKEIWEEHRSTNTTTYDQTFVQDGLNLAGLYVDRGSNGLATIIYERLIAYDCAHLPPTDSRIGRDLNNLGLCYLQTGEGTAEWKVRKEWFEKAIATYGNAEKILRASPQSQPQLICNLQNQVIAYSELGNTDRALELSNIVNKQLDAWHEHQTKSEKRI